MPKEELTEDRETEERRGGSEKREEMREFGFTETILGSKAAFLHILFVLPWVAFFVFWMALCQTRNRKAPDGEELWNAN